MALSRLFIQHQFPRILVVGVRITHSDAANKDFFTKNKELNRPMSPHLTIYQPQLTWTMSIVHRMTGVFLTTEVSAISLTYLMCGQDFTSLVNILQGSVHPAIIGLNKFILAYTFSYHTFNGIRHLAWDTGRGFQLSTLYRSGYVVLVLSLLSALGLAFYKP
ncbi:succinate dehydrogenase cytochrome b560 subunit, mitochondrial-like [Dysidea avara]|uniref:succinate dehydrogenase cytochrome b560 subunit, mitochondrial-like n=1 Tax=Dysidea avara TaxID=196820 RepID=UPI00331BEC3E